MASNVLDFALNYFGPATEDELYPALQDAQEPALTQFLEAYRTFAASEAWIPPKLQPSIVRPYLPNTNSRSWTVGGLQLDYTALKKEGAEWKLVDAIKHRLLYCHSLALDDPLGDLLSLVIAKLQLYEDDTGRRALMRFINILLHFKSLIRSHIICLIPSRIYSPTAIDRDMKLDDLANILAEFKDYDISEHVEAAPEEVRAEWQSQELIGHELLRQGATIKASSHIAAGIEAVLHAPDSVSLYLPFRADVDMLKHSTRVNREILPEKLSDLESWFLNELIDIEMPGVTELDPSVLVEIRAGEEFTAWRSALSEALQAAHELPQKLWRRDEEAKRVFRNHLAGGKQHLESQLKKSPVLTGLKSGRTSIIVGLMGLSVSALLDPTGLTKAEIASILASSATAGAIDAIETRKPSASNASLTHYVAALS